MWQIEWMLRLIPDTVFVWITAILFFGGVIAYILSKLVSIIPFVGRYKIALELGSIAALIVGAYFFCGVVYREQVAELKEKIRVSEEQSRQANRDLADALKEKSQVIKDKNKVLQEQLNLVATKIDSQCKITPDTTRILNEAARRPRKKQ